MATKKQIKLNIPKLTAKETLIAYVQTLTEKQSKEAYQLLLERFDCKRARVMKFDRNGVQQTNNLGKVRLTKGEYDRVIQQFGEIYFHRAVEILYDYISNLEVRAESESVARQRLREYQKISHYYKITKGWVNERVLNEMNINSKATHSPYNNSLSVWDIDNPTQAQRYIDELPSELKVNNPEIEYLVTRFPQLIVRDL